MHAYRYPAHEQQVATLAREMGFPQVSASHEASPLIKLVSRGDTTVVDAYLSPILRKYVEQVAEDLAGSSLPRRGRVDASASERTGGVVHVTPHPAPSAPPSPLRGEGSPRLMFMTSAGGLTAAHLFQGKDAILSGPAGGVVGMVETGRTYGPLIGFD